MPAAASLPISSGATLLGASVSITAPQSTWASLATSASVIARMKRSIMGALARRIEKRSFDVNAEHTGHPCRARFPDRRDGFFHDLGRVGNDRRQQSRRAELAMRCGDAFDGFDRWIVIEQRTAAAIDLNVDESRYQQTAGKLPAFNSGSESGRSVTTSAMRDPSTTTARPSRIVSPSKMRAPVRAKCHHTVSVTFLSSRGRSGSRPRACGGLFNKTIGGLDDRDRIEQRMRRPRPPAGRPPPQPECWRRSPAFARWRRALMLAIDPPANRQEPENLRREVRAARA